MPQTVEVAGGPPTDATKPDEVEWGTLAVVVDRGRSSLWHAGDVVLVYKGAGDYGYVASVGSRRKEGASWASQCQVLVRPFRPGERLAFE